MTPDDSPYGDVLWGANHAPRCEHLKINGARCKAPARRSQRFCRFHESRPDYRPPMIEDFSSLLFAVVQALRALHDKAVDHKTCALTLYGLQIAASVVKGYREETSRYDDDMEHDSHYRAVAVRKRLEEMAADDPKFAALLEAASRLQSPKLPPHAELGDPALETNAG